MMIRRRRKTREIEFSFDSFLDVVANVVGIILRLILVAWVGARSYKAVEPVALPALTKEEIAELPDPQDPLAPELERQRRELAAAQAHLLEQLKDWKKLREDSTLTAEELTRITSQVQGVGTERKNLEAKTQQDAQSVRSAGLSLQEIRERSKNVVAEIEALRKAPPQKQTLRYRVPVSHPLTTEAYAFECRRGRVSFIDVAAFQDEILRVMNDDGGRALRGSGRFSGVTQAFGAFRMRYTWERNAATGQNETFSEVEPVILERGETLEQALAPGSAFRKLIDNCEPKSTAVTLWVYPDSFPLYRNLRDYMHERDLIVAGRPLPEDIGISYGSLGTHSLGQ